MSTEHLTQELVDAVGSLKRRLEPGHAERADLERRVRLTRARRRLQRRVTWVGGLLLAAAAVLMVLVWPRDSTEVELASSAGAWVEHSLPNGVSMRLSGAAHLEAAGDTVDLELQRGAVEVQVPPGRELQVVVRTPVALVRVVGTVFTVERGPVGTRVAVTRGTVSVSCADEPEQQLEAGAELHCFRSAAAGLAHARALESEGGAPEHVLGAVAQALAMDHDDATLHELTVVQVEALAALGRTTEALEVAEAGLARAEAGPRAVDLRILAAQLAHPLGCDRTVVHYEALVAARHPDPMPAILWASCVQTEEPERARELLEDALQLELTAEQKRDLQARLEAL